jgi:hypothetical protein
VAAEQRLMRISRTNQADIWPRRNEYHVLTYAEEGFAPLNIHAESYGVSKRQLVAFADRVNERHETGSLYLTTPVTAVPRTLIREMRDEHALRRCIEEFFLINSQTIRATKILCDFRTPHVQAFVIVAIEAASKCPAATSVEEVAIIQ